MPEQLSDLEITLFIAEHVMGYRVVHCDHIYDDDASTVYPKLIVSPSGHTTRIMRKKGGWTLFYPTGMIHNAWEVIEHFQAKRDAIDNSAWVNFSNALRGDMLYTLTQEQACRAICAAAMDTVKLCQQK